MRWALCGLLILAAGCGKNKPMVDQPETTPGKTAPEPAPVSGLSEPKRESKKERPPAFDTRGLPPREWDYLDDYKENEFAADRKWKGKRFILNVSLIDFGRAKDGRLWVSSEGILGHPHTAYFYLAPGQDDEVTKLKKQGRVTLEATCDGREDDGRWRGIQGYNFRVNFSDCVILPTDPEKS